MNVAALHGNLVPALLQDIAVGAVFPHAPGTRLFRTARDERGVDHCVAIRARYRGQAASKEGKELCPTPAARLPGLPGLRPQPCILLMAPNDTKIYRSKGCEQKL